MPKLHKVLAAALVLGAAIVFGAAIASSQFDEVPGAPLPVAQSSEFGNFDFQVYHSGPADWYTPPAMQAQHGADCSGPPNSHPALTYADAVYVCNAHVMTAMNAGYGEIMITPNKLLDWTNGPATISFELSTLQMSGRDWVDIFISPWLENVATPFEIGFEEFPRSGYQLNHAFQCTFVLNKIENFQRSQLSPDVFGCDLSVFVVPGTNTAAARQPFRVTVSKTNIRMEMMPSSTNRCAPVSCLILSTNLSVPTSFTQGVVQFGHHSYTPEKDGAGVPATWHWDEFNLFPNIPFTLIKADKRIIPSSAGGNDRNIHFAAPAPVNSYLRFSAQAGSVEVSFNGGSTWQVAVAKNGPSVPDHLASSYFHPMPQGAQNVLFRGANGGVGWMARDFAIFSLGGAPLSTSTPSVSTLTPLASTPTSTPITSTATPLASTPTSTATSVVPATSTPTPLVLPTSTSTPVIQVCRLRVQYGPASAPLEGYVDQPLAFCAGAHP